MTEIIQLGADDDHEVLERFFGAGGSIRMLADIAQSDMDKLFSYATQLFDAGEPRAACNFLMMLARIDHWNFDYWFMLGLSYQHLAQHEEAIFCFSRAGMIRIDDPRASFRAGISYRLVGNLDYAIKAFRAALKWCGDRDTWRDIKAGVMEQLAHCEREE
ncbi:CesD/SycD/LcrH family type III secretion system chaperone [Burkholderia sp. Bp9126]|nr:CesD/SycD/LcrH family type III secretion system chaperone [Burkholderia sp. Bp9126]